MLDLVSMKSGPPIKTEFSVRSGFMKRIWLTIFLAGLSAGCGFDRNWRNLSRSGAPPTDALAGRWEGKWVSEQNGHTGKLRAILTRVDESHYRADFDAMFFAVLRAGYSISLTAKPQAEGTISFEGKENLGALAGGVYRYNGSANGEAFHATYTASVDRGTFEMKRP